MVTFRLANFAGPRKDKKNYFYDNAVPAATTYQDKQTMLAPYPGWPLENIVASAMFELTKHSLFGTQLFHWRQDNMEIDFVLKENNHETPIAIEIGSSMKHSRASMHNMLAQFPQKVGKAYLVTPDAVADHAGDIKTLPLFEFLLAVEHRKNILITNPSAA